MVTAGGSRIIGPIFDHYDEICRTDLASGQIVSERGYVASWLALVRHHVRRLSTSQIAVVQNLWPRDEQRLGCDVIIVLKVSGGYKVGLFEMKWPRATQSSYSWDNIKSHWQKSRFNRQLDGQHQIKDSALVGEVILSEAPNNASNPKEFLPYGSTCVEHEPTCQFRRGKSWNRWTTKRLRAFLAGNVQTERLGTMLDDLAECGRGPPLTSVDGGYLSIPLEGEYPQFFGDERTSSWQVPLVPEAEVRTVSSFMSEAGLRGYVYIDATDDEIQALRRPDERPDPAHRRDS